METAYLSPHLGATCPGAQKGQTSAAKPAGGDLSPPPPAPTLLAGRSPEETPTSSDGRRNSGVKKHHHKHNLKHRYELLETLGRGTYGKVKKAIERHSGREVSHYEAGNIRRDAVSWSRRVLSMHTSLASFNSYSKHHGSSRKCVVVLRGVCASFWEFPVRSKGFAGPWSCGCTRLVLCGASRPDAVVQIRLLTDWCDSSGPSNISESS